MVPMLGSGIPKQRGDWTWLGLSIPAALQLPESTGTSLQASSWKQGLALKLLFAALGTDRRRTGGWGDDRVLVCGIGSCKYCTSEVRLLPLSLFCVLI